MKFKFKNHILDQSRNVQSILKINDNSKSSSFDFFPLTLVKFNNFFFFFFYNLKVMLLVRRHSRMVTNTSEEYFFLSSLLFLFTPFLPCLLPQQPWLVCCKGFIKIEEAGKKDEDNFKFIMAVLLSHCFHAFLIERI